MRPSQSKNSGAFTTEFSIKKRWTPSGLRRRRAADFRVENSSVRVSMATVRNTMAFGHNTAGTPPYKVNQYTNFEWGTDFGKTASHLSQRGQQCLSGHYAVPSHFNVLTDNKLLAYETVLRPILGCGTIVGAPYARKSINKLKGEQWEAVRIVCIKILINSRPRALTLCVTPTLMPYVDVGVARYF